MQVVGRGRGRGMLDRSVGCVMVMAVSRVWALVVVCLGCHSHSQSSRR